MIYALDTNITSQNALLLNTLLTDMIESVADNSCEEEK